MLNDGQPTFLSKKWNSVINLCILQGRISNSNNISLITDDEAELFIGAPLKGHIPVVITLHRNVKRIQTNTKPWFKKGDWESWSQALSPGFDRNNSIQVGRSHAWDTINEAIHTATREHIPTKKDCTHNYEISYSQTPASNYGTYVKYLNTTFFLGMVLDWKKRKKLSKICHETAQQTG